MSYLVAVLSDRIKAEEAYTALEDANIKMDNVEILGRGFKSADEYGLIDPTEEAWKQIKRLALGTIPFGFAGGFAFNAITGLDTFPWAGVVGNQIIGGFLGAIAGAMGSFFIGGGVGAGLGGGDALSYRNRLNAGKYLVVVKGSEGLISQASRVIRPLRPENIQGYTEPGAY
ncbi:MAG: hypothetical protein HLUCCA11_16545 [Phormidesmis priestleyi Ana]|uniref:Uncharacterized protein n=1 Tax=Phormidesmis priestleyi Ana TaxID=1666911 RepID=A0A0P7YTX6_9CYAN|nr:MAG: hypothetical protein HLUCCA11_16545 [Phormidesmis priestleyi Ana]